MALGTGIDARAAVIMGEIQALSKAQQATGLEAMKILLTQVMRHIEANGVITIPAAGNTIDVASVSGVQPGGGVSGPGAGTIDSNQSGTIA